ncbi:CHAP domain-containing protein [Sinomicrobium weinanense]|uniref:CHAP domain-containing protein n=1 Tax=Sinomicrobium weinanense TaxID=2842200 RepID=A0A926JUL3_9FLAO|nr:CHAP domain-containing protein [Sinomicrobium weinanense]MBC9797850.1 CHAP domain-containing protein [Sinomicrobium weinanense]MBU3122250.1 CHAP domain-containing protein [Sinomicrobium weinanense]
MRYCGLPERHEWCAAFVSWCHGKAGYSEPRNAWAAALFPSGRTVWRMRNWRSASGGRSSVNGDRKTPRRGDVFGIYLTHKKRIAHCGFVDGWDGKYCLTVEGNVDDAVVRKRRPVRTIAVVARWTVD